MTGLCAPILRVAVEVAHIAPARSNGCYDAAMLPRIAIVGRPNVGKSSLLNMLAGRRVSIVEPTAGVTRDRVSVELELPPEHKGGPTRWVEVSDTGGYGVYSDDQTYHVLTADIEGQIAAAIGHSDLILFVTDAQVGIADLDERVARLLRKQAGDTPVLLVANKADNETLELEAQEMARLGFGEPICVAAASKRNKWGLIEQITDHIDWDVDRGPRAAAELRIAIVGKRNAGKSTFVNALVGSTRVIASDLPGTTRDAVDVAFEFAGRRLLAIDTAGVRKRKSLEDDVAYYSTHRTLRTIRRADVVLLLIDATEDISQVDKKLAQHVTEHYKPTVIVVNKWDRVADRVEPDDYLDYIAQQLKGLTYAPIIFTSAIANDHVPEAVELAIDLYRQAAERVGTGELNQVVRDILTQRGPSSKLGRKAKIYYVTQAAANPPTIVLFVNDPDLFTNQYQRYMINNFRTRLPFEEVPIKLVVRGRQRRSATADEAPVAQA